jgi:YgiT-type zinc finger domain-containing protein
MVCCMCKGTLRKDKRTYVATLKECVIIVKDIPALVCDQCGEVYYTDDVSDKLEKIVNKLKLLIKEVAIVDYEKVA